MKVTYVEQIEQKFTLSKKMCCTVCGSHRYEIVKQLQPESPLPWKIRCSHCGVEGFDSPTQDIAIERWKQL